MDYLNLMKDLSQSTPSKIIMLVIDGLGGLQGLGIEGIIALVGVLLGDSRVQSPVLLSLESFRPVEGRGIFQRDLGRGGVCRQIGKGRNGGRWGNFRCFRFWCRLRLGGTFFLGQHGLVGSRQGDLSNLVLDLRQGLSGQSVIVSHDDRCSRSVGGRRGVILVQSDRALVGPRFVQAGFVHGVIGP